MSAGPEVDVYFGGVGRFEVSERRREAKTPRVGREAKTPRLEEILDEAVHDASLTVEYNPADDPDVVTIKVSKFDIETAANSFLVSAGFSLQWEMVERLHKVLGLLLAIREPAA